MLLHYALFCLVLTSFAASQGVDPTWPGRMDSGSLIRYYFNLLLRNCALEVGPARASGPPESPWDDPGRRGLLSNVIVNGTICTCNLGLRVHPQRDDYTYTADIGWHKLHRRAALWNDARKTCIDEGGHLAIINSNAEARVLVDIFARADSIEGAADPTKAFIGIHNYFALQDWVTVQGDSLAKAGFSGWAGGQPDNSNGNQHCGAFMKAGTVDDIECDIRLPYFCELPLMEIL